jgi:hypothetical protein
LITVLGNCCWVAVANFLPYIPAAWTQSDWGTVIPWSSWCIYFFQRKRTLRFSCNGYKVYFERNRSAFLGHIPWSRNNYPCYDIRSRKPKSTAVGIRRADHATLSVRQSWHYADKRRSLSRYSSLAD